MSVSRGACFVLGREAAHQPLHNQCRAGDREQGAHDQRDDDGEPLVPKPRQVHHDADAGRHEEQREMLQQSGCSGPQFLGYAPAEQQGAQKQDEFDHGPGNGQAEPMRNRFAGQLENQQYRQ